MSIYDQTEFKKYYGDRHRFFFIWCVLTFSLSYSLVFIAKAMAPAPDIPKTDAQKRAYVYQMYDDYKKDFPEVVDISTRNILSRTDRQKIVFVDVRTPKEQKVSMLPNAITQKEFLKRIDQNPEQYKNALIVGYCTISYRSGKFAQKMGKRGIHMVNLKAGILGWIHDGGHVYRNGKVVYKVHVYGKKWDLAPEKYKTVY